MRTVHPDGKSRALPAVHPDPGDSVQNDDRIATLVLPQADTVADVQRRLPVFQRTDGICVQPLFREVGEGIVRSLDFSAPMWYGVVP